ncbi:MAG: hypothetical protein VXW22_14365 [Pseudomonadota bacterium]|nr:hypothetical protein [Pseudomonadota bacterium]
MSILSSSRLILISCLVSCAQGEYVDCSYVLKTDRVQATGKCEITGEVQWLRDVDTVHLIAAGVKYGVNPEEMDEFDNGDFVSIRGTYSKSGKPFLYLSDLDRAKRLEPEGN